MPGNGGVEVYVECASRAEGGLDDDSGTIWLSYQFEGGYPQTIVIDLKSKIEKGGIREPLPPKPGEPAPPPPPPPTTMERQPGKTPPGDDAGTAAREGARKIGETVGKPTGTKPSDAAKIRVTTKSKSTPAASHTGQGRDTGAGASGGAPTGGGPGSPPAGGSPPAPTPGAAPGAPGTPTPGGDSGPVQRDTDRVQTWARFDFTDLDGIDAAACNKKIELKFYGSIEHFKTANASQIKRYPLGVVIEDKTGKDSGDCPKGVHEPKDPPPPPPPPPPGPPDPDWKTVPIPGAPTTPSDPPPAGPTGPAPGGPGGGMEEPGGMDGGGAGMDDRGMGGGSAGMGDMAIVEDDATMLAIGVLTLSTGLDSAGIDNDDMIVPFRILYSSPWEQIVHPCECIRGAGIASWIIGRRLIISHVIASRQAIVRFELKMTNGHLPPPWHWTFVFWSPDPFGRIPALPDGPATSVIVEEQLRARYEITEAFASRGRSPEVCAPRL